MRAIRWALPGISSYKCCDDDDDDDDDQGCQVRVKDPAQRSPKSSLKVAQLIQYETTQQNVGNHGIGGTLDVPCWLGQDLKLAQFGGKTAELATVMTMTACTWRRRR